MSGMEKKGKLTHLDEAGKAKMVDVGDKPSTDRTAVARVHVLLSPATLDLVRQGDGKRGDLRTVVETAGIMASKRTSELIPHCHPLPLDNATVEVTFSDDLPGVVIETSASTHARTGVEMEALTAAAVAALTVYDMVKAVEPNARISDLCLVEKRGGRSGDVLPGHEA
jgi:cyclic pyranopterin phosphate synthase